MRKVALALAVIPMLGVGGYFATEAWTCSKLNDDYLNTVSTLKGNAILQSVATDADMELSLRQMQDRQLGKLEAALSAIYQRCGMQAGQSAAREGTEMLL